MFFLLLLVRLLLLHSLCELIVSVLSIGTSLSIHTTKIIPPLYLDLLHALTTIWLKERSSATTPSSQSLVLPLNIRSCHYLSWYLLCLMCLSLINRKIPPSSPSECKDGTSKESPVLLRNGQIWRGVGIKDTHNHCANTPGRLSSKADRTRRFYPPHKGVSSSLLVFMSGLDFKELIPERAYSMKLHWIGFPLIWQQMVLLQH